LVGQLEKNNEINARKKSASDDDNRKIDETSYRQSQKAKRRRASKLNTASRQFDKMVANKFTSEDVKASIIEEEEEDEGDNDGDNDGGDGGDGDDDDLDG